MDKEVEMTKSVNDLETSRSIFGRQYPTFETLDARIAAALKKIIQNSNFRREVHFAEQRGAERRPIPPYENFWVTGTDETILDSSNLTGATPREGDAPGVDTRTEPEFEMLIS